MLWALLPLPCADVAPDGAVTAGGAGCGSGDKLGPDLGGWGHFSGGSAPGQPRRSALVALDVTDRSALSCSRARDWGQEGDPAPFCMEWRGGRVGGGQDREEVGGPGGLSARFVERVSVHDFGDDGGGAARERARRLGLARWPGGLASGVALMRETVDHGCSLMHDRFEDSVLVCGRSGLKRILTA